VFASYSKTPAGRGKGKDKRAEKENEKKRRKDIADTEVPAGKIPYKMEHIEQNQGYK
jgi:hypothetical protein